MPSSKSWVLLREDKNAGKTAKNGVPKSGFGDRQVGAFSVFCVRHTGIPFIFWAKSAFFHKIVRFRGWCNTTPVCPEKEPDSWAILTSTRIHWWMLVGVVGLACCTSSGVNWVGVAE